MSSSSIQLGTDPQQRQLIAPAWHTIALVIALLAMSAYGARAVRSTPLIASHKLLHYAVIIAVEWILVAFILWGTKKHTFRELVGGHWNKPKDVLLDVGIALMFLLASYVVLIVVALLLLPGHSAGLERILPHTRTELETFALVALSAGFAEEIIFRGYLQKQLLSVSGNKPASIILQAVAFGASHGYQGTKRMALLGVFGCLFGILASWRKSLRPGMIAHTIFDLVGGLVFFVRH